MPKPSICHELRMLPGEEDTSTSRMGWHLAQTAVWVMEWLRSKFADKVISSFTDMPWRATAFDFSLLDYCFWSICLTEHRKNLPNSLQELEDTVGENTPTFGNDKSLQPQCGSTQYTRKHQIWWRCIWVQAEQVKRRIYH